MIHMSWWYDIASVSPLSCIMAWTQATGFWGRMPWISEFAGAQIPCAGIPGENPCLHQPHVLGADDIRCLPGIAFTPGSLAAVRGCGMCFIPVHIRSSARGLSLATASSSFWDHLRRKTNWDGRRESSKLDAFLRFFSRLDALEGGGFYLMRDSGASNSSASRLSWVVYCGCKLLNSTLSCPQLDSPTDSLVRDGSRVLWADNLIVHSLLFPVKK